MLEIQNGHSKKITDLENQLSELQAETKQMKNDTQSAIQHKANEYITATRLADNVHANFQCKKCGTIIGLMIGSNECPNCHTSI